MNNKKNKKMKTHGHTIVWWLPEGSEVGAGKGKYMVAEDFTVGYGHTMQYTEDAL